MHVASAEYMLLCPVGEEDVSPAPRGGQSPEPDQNYWYADHDSLSRASIFPGAKGILPIL